MASRTRIVMLMRHGEAEGFSMSGTDAGRRLTPHGHAQAKTMATYANAAWRGHGLVPDMVLHSPFVRATQTAEHVAGALGAPRVVERGITPGGDAADMAEFLWNLPGGSLAVVSHMPFLPALVHALTHEPCTAAFHTATCVWLRLTDGDGTRSATLLEHAHAAQLMG